MKMHFYLPVGMLVGCVVISHISTADICNNMCLTNVDYIGIGYDIFTGNPRGDVYDIGFKKPVIELEYSESQVSADHKWIIPDNTQALQVTSCSYATDSTEINGMKSYQKSLEVDVGLESPDVPAKFSASVGYQSVYEGTSNYNFYYLESVAKCTVYSANVIDIQKIRLTKSFQDAVRNLPTVTNNDSYVAFFMNYGTHLITELVMGAKVITRSEFEEKAWSEMHRRDLDLKLGAGLPFGEASAGYQTQTTTKQTLECLSYSYKQFYLGSRPPPDGNFSSWAQSVDKSPYPIEYTLRALTDLFSANLIPGSWQSDLDIKKALFNEALDFYCNQFLSRKGCNVPTPDRPFNSKLSDPRCGGSKSSTKERLRIGAVVALVFTIMTFSSV